jgi:hypothetical protein
MFPGHSSRLLLVIAHLVCSVTTVALRDWGMLLLAGNASVPSTFVLCQVLSQNYSSLNIRPDLCESEGKRKVEWDEVFFLVVLNGRGATHLDYRREESLSRESLAKARYRWNSKETGICQEGRE